MNHYFLTCILLLAAANGFAQEREHIETDRPNETEVPYLVPKKNFQIEAGLKIEKSKENTRLISYPVMLAKYGLSDLFELRVKTSYSTQIEHYIPDDKISSGVQPVEIGFKVAVLKEKKWIPKTAFLFQTGVPRVSSAVFKANHLAPTLRVLLENNITEKFSINYNVGAEWDGYETTPQWVYTFVPGIDLGDHVHVFAEVYSFAQKKKAPEYTLDGGMEYFIGKNIALDLCSGFGVNKAAPPYFFTIGGSVRFR